MAEKVIIRAFKNEETNRYKDENGQYYLDAFFPDDHVNYGRIAYYGRVSTDFRGNSYGEASLEYYWGTRKVDYSLSEVKEFVAEIDRTFEVQVELRERLQRPFGGWAK